MSLDVFLILLHLCMFALLTVAVLCNFPRRCEAGKWHAAKAVHRPHILKSVAILKTVPAKPR